MILFFVVSFFRQKAKGADVTVFWTLLFLRCHISGLSAAGDLAQLKTLTSMSIQIIARLRTCATFWTLHQRHHCGVSFSPVKKDCEVSGSWYCDRFVHPLSSYQTVVRSPINFVTWCKLESCVLVWKHMTMNSSRLTPDVFFLAAVTGMVWYRVDSGLELSTLSTSSVGVTFSNSDNIPRGLSESLILSWGANSVCIKHIEFN